MTFAFGENTPSPVDPEITTTPPYDILSLDGGKIGEANPIHGSLITAFHSPALLLFRSHTPTAKAHPQGTILLLPGGAYRVLEMHKEGVNTARFLNACGFDVALLQYHVSSEMDVRDLALSDALKAYFLLRTKGGSLGLRQGRLGIMGYSAGGHLAARTVAALSQEEQPDDLMLIYPAYLDEAAPGTSTPLVAPPKHPRSLFARIGARDSNVWIEGCRNYGKQWAALGGASDFQILPNAAHAFSIVEHGAGATIWQCQLRDYLK